MPPPERDAGGSGRVLLASDTGNQSPSCEGFKMTFNAPLQLRKNWGSASAPPLVSIRTWAAIRRARLNAKFTKDKSAKLFIFGLNKKFSKSQFMFFKSKNIYFYGRVSKTKLKKVYQDSLAMICLGYDETFCLNALEANSCGLPIITFAKTALKDYSKHNYNMLHHVHRRSN